MATVARAIHCELLSNKPGATPRRELGGQVPVLVQTVKVGEPENVKIVLQPRLCTLRSYGSDGRAVMKTRNEEVRQGNEESSFFKTLSVYIESSKKSQDFEIISGRLAMIVFAATVTTEFVTGNSLFRKMELQGIAEAVGVCLGAMASAAAFAWLSSARNNVGRIFTLSCNSFIDSVIDRIVDGLFYESDPNDWFDDI
ncbi:stress enhanced protein 2, chloroplastic-like [Durio zibethinus]|uniref:Stress enhanced protein 2, chloroplastic-like n=1 Tax=Durio zibethinus TaxID=66656 RepID=A0A6P5ZHR4_DURZI|nr:stress enhanced protein 2, chloroplastic-like [Durio zibethinus]XP_022752019.1 stress enhanced protein 2, chloroplastic-like [Durio zibethinus]XP_022752020.1 stress enhanced protein 2, chloroplastic-like [Durio zibethinus]